MNLRLRLLAFVFAWFFASSLMASICRPQCCFPPPPCICLCPSDHGGEWAVIEPPDLRNGTMNPAYFRHSEAGGVNNLGNTNDRCVFITGHWQDQEHCNRDWYECTKKWHGDYWQESCEKHEKCHDHHAVPEPRSIWTLAIIGIVSVLAFLANPRSSTTAV